MDADDEHHQENREIKNPAVAMKPEVKSIISNIQITNTFQSQHGKQKNTYTFQSVYTSILH